MEHDSDIEHCEFCGAGLKDGSHGYGTTSGTVSSGMEGFGPDEDPWINISCPECQNRNSGLLFGFKPYIETQVKELVEFLKKSAEGYDITFDGSMGEGTRILFEEPVESSEQSEIAQKCGEMKALFKLAEKFKVNLSPDTIKLEGWSNV